MKKLWQAVEAADLNQEIIKESAPAPLPNGLTYEELIEELDEFRNETRKKVRQFERLLRATPYYNAAKSYWMGHILSALGDPDYYTHATTVEKTMKSIEEDRDSSGFDDDGDGMDTMLGRDKAIGKSFSLDDSITQGDWEPVTDIYNKG